MKEKKQDTCYYCGANIKVDWKLAEICDTGYVKCWNCGKSLHYMRPHSYKSDKFDPHGDF